MPATSRGEHSYEREREMLLGMIFNLQKRIDALQEQLENQPQHGAEPTAHILHDAGLRPEAAEAPHYPTSLVVAPRREEVVGYSEVVPSSPETLQDKEREAIRRALERNEGRRKAAAAELNISERTLYRKIKEYGLE